MDALLITDVSAETALIMFAIVGVLLASVLAGVLIAFGWVLKCTVERLVKRSMCQSESNGGSIKTLTERLDAVLAAVERRGRK